jgi:hypothetical protein
MTATVPISSVFGERDLIGTFHMGARGSNPDWFVDPDALPAWHFHRTYHFHEHNRFEVHYVFFADEKCTIPQISAIWEGRWWLLEAHPVLSFTRLADFRLDKVRVAIIDRQLFEQTPEAKSGDWSFGLFRDVSFTGCKSFGPLFEPLPRECTDYDIVFLREGILKTGLRTSTMAVGAEGRPTKLQDALPAIREQDHLRQTKRLSGA